MSAEFGKIKRLAAADADDDFGRFGQAESYFGYFFNIDKTHVLFINRFNAVFLQPGIKTVGQKALDSSLQKITALVRFLSARYLPIF